jgi:hypothetical protein
MSSTKSIEQYLDGLPYNHILKNVMVISETVLSSLSNPLQHLSLRVRSVVKAVGFWA